MSSNTDTKSAIAKLEKQQEQIKARIQKLKAAESSKRKKEDTRRKILVGAYLLDKSVKDETLVELYEKMRIYLTRPADKKLFD
jgi:large subunit ribosomal protein L7/L12